MESHPQNPEFRNHPENVHPCVLGMLIGTQKRMQTDKTHIRGVIQKYAEKCYIFFVKLAIPLILRKSTP